MLNHHSIMHLIISLTLTLLQCSFNTLLRVYIILTSRLGDIGYCYAHLISKVGSLIIVNHLQLHSDGLYDADMSVKLTIKSAKVNEIIK